MHSFHIVMTEKVKQEVDSMCNLSQGLKEDTREEEKQDTILRLLKDGRGTDIMAAATGWTIEHVQNFLKSRNLQPAQ